VLPLPLLLLLLLLLQVLVRAALPQWCQPKEWGVLLLVYSAVLSRGCDGLASDMDTETRLVDALGYCSMELVNLLLTGDSIQGWVGWTGCGYVCVWGASGRCSALQWSDV
jgi:hypothetical protein